MSHPFQHPAAKPLLNRVARLFSEDGTFIAKDSNIVFVCGGPYSDAKTMRRRFMDYAEQVLPHLRMFLAENAEKDYVTHDEPEFHNVAEFEELIAEVSDCVIIFSESVGSYVELGYFANVAAVRKISLIVHPADLQSDDSFLLRGPVDLYDKNSDFRKVIHIDFEKPNLKLISDRIIKRIPEIRRKKFQSKDYRDLTLKEKFFIVFSIIELFLIVTVEGVEFAFKSLFKHSNKSDIKHLLSIMVAAELIERHPADRDHFRILLNRPFIDFTKLSRPAFKLNVLHFYSEHFPELAALTKVQEK